MEARKVAVNLNPTLRRDRTERWEEEEEEEESATLKDLEMRPGTALCPATRAAVRVPVENWQESKDFRGKSEVHFIRSFKVGVGA